MPRRAGFYYDGFNIYHAIRDLGKPHLKWASYQQMAQRIVLRGDQVQHVKIFTAYAVHIPNAVTKHRLLVEAWKHEGCEVILGQFKQRKTWCRNCRQHVVGHEEKETDVNIALHLLRDAMTGLVDVAYIVSTDSDLAPAARMIRQFCPNVELVTVATPGRKHSFEMLSVCHAKSKLNEAALVGSLMPQTIALADGTILVRPTEYDPPV